MPARQAASGTKLNYPKLLERRKNLVEDRLRLLTKGRRPQSVYEQISYAISAGGKRLRAVLALLACESVGGTAHSALDAAVAIELLHNFTLIHDDIMDHSLLRRGRATVHRKWNPESAILSGDQLAALSYDFLLSHRGARSTEMARVFTDAFVAVCEGQGYDKEFESRHDTTVDDYRMMIGKKTAAVISAATELGALAGNGSAAQVKALRNYGTHLGMAFQLRDDVLDIAGASKQTGKKVGSDILEGKRTFLLLTAAARAKGNDRAVINRVLRRHRLRSNIIPLVRDIYRRTGALDDAARMIEQETASAQRALARLRPGQAASLLSWLAAQLIVRTS